MRGLSQLSTSGTKISIVFESTYPISVILKNPIGMVVLREAFVAGSSLSFVPDVKGIYTVAFDNSTSNLSTKITLKGEISSAGKTVPPRGVIFILGTEGLLYTPTSVPSPTPTPNPIIIYTPTPTSTPALSPSLTKTTSTELKELMFHMLNLINNDRRIVGLAPVVLGNNVAAQKHAEDRLIADYSSHWGRDGMKPYMRYTLAGGYNYEAENGFVTRTTWISGKDPFYRREPIDMLEGAQKSLMDSPGHRINILNKWHKKVNLGIAYSNDSLHLVQQFEGDYVELQKAPYYIQQCPLNGC